MNRLHQLIREIHRRNVWQVLAGFAVGSFAVLQAIDLLIDRAGLPAWTFMAAMYLMAAGLPVVVVTAVIQGGSGNNSPNVQSTSTGLAAGSLSAARLFTWRNALFGGFAAFILVLAGGLGARVIGGGPRGSIEPSIAVIPCDDLSPASDQEELAHGMAEELSVALAQLPELTRVSGRASTTALKEQGADLQAIGRTLGVANVLTCAVVRDADDIRVTAVLSAAADGSVLWSGRYDEAFTDIFSVLDRVARAIVDELQLAVSGDDIVRSATNDPDAHQAYLRGRHQWNRRRGESIGAAIAEFERAISLDSAYSDAWSGLADAYLWYPTYARVPDGDWIERGLSAAQRAVSLDRRSGMARTSLALANVHLDRWAVAEREFAEAIELSPGYASAHQWTGLLFRRTGRSTEAVVAARRAVEIDPVSSSINEALGKALLIAERLDESITQYERTIALDPSWPPAWRDLSFALMDAGRFDEALDAHLTWARLAGADSRVARSLVEAVRSYRESGDPQALEVPDDYPLGEGEIASVYAATGQRERALRFAEKWALDRDYGRLATFHVPGTVGIKDVLNGDPYYQSLLSEAGITW